MKSETSTGLIMYCNLAMFATDLKSDVLFVTLISPFIYLLIIIIQVIIIIFCHV